jgi:hypothetical protein
VKRVAVSPVVNQFEIVVKGHGFTVLLKNLAFCPPEGAGGFSLPNKIPPIQCGFTDCGKALLMPQF